MNKVLTLNTKMLFHYDVSLKEVQVQEGKSHPEHSSLPPIACPSCGTRLIGHGWRTRNVSDIECKATLIWVHRLLCPFCRLTFTVLPSWVHASKISSLGTIRKLISYRIVNGHKDSRSKVSRRLQELWYRSFERQYRSSGFMNGFPTRSSFLHDNPIPAGFPYIKIVKDHADCVMALAHPPHAHHRLLLFWQRPP